MRLYKAFCVGSSAVLAATLLAACQGNSGFKSRKFTKAEFAAAQREAQTRACAHNPTCIPPAQVNVDTGSTNTQQTNTQQVSNQQIVNQQVGSQVQPRQQSQGQVQQNPTQVQNQSTATKSVAQTNTGNTQQPTQLSQADLEEAQAKFIQETVLQRDALISQDNAKLQQKDPELDQIFEGLSAEATSQSGKSNDLMLAVDALLKFGDQVRDLSVRWTPLRYSKDGQVLPLKINLQKNFQSLMDKSPVSTFPILVRAVCQDQNCQSYQVRFDFAMSDKTRTAVFQYRLTGQNYVLIASNLQEGPDQLKSYADAKAEREKQQQAKLVKQAAQQKQQVGTSNTNATANTNSTTQVKAVQDKKDTKTVTASATTAKAATTATTTTSADAQKKTQPAPKANTSTSDKTDFSNIPASDIDNMVPTDI